MGRIIGALAGLALAVTAGVACSTNPPPVSMHADASGLTALRGSWAGEYWSGETGRHGTIRFELSAPGDTARGEVVMIPEGRSSPLPPVQSPEWCGPDEETMPVAGRSRERAELLTIHFVRAYGSRVQGTLDAYRDPGSGHRLVTTFRGDVSGDTIRGSYSSYDCENGRRAAGEWRVTRQ